MRAEGEYEVVWDGSHQDRDADLLRRDLATPEKVRAWTPPIIRPPCIVTGLRIFLVQQQGARWWTVTELAQHLRQQRESVRSALRILGPAVERRALLREQARDPRWAYRWRRSCEPS